MNTRYASERAACRDALLIVDPGASNACGVATSLWDMLCWLRGGNWTGRPGEHPAVFLTLNHLHQLLGSPDIDDTAAFSKAYDYCIEKTRGVEDARLSAAAAESGEPAPQEGKRADKRVCPACGWGACACIPRGDEQLPDNAS
jgi:hypothetical protein